MNEDEHYCPQCGRLDHQCKCDCPMRPKPNAATDAASKHPDIDNLVYQEMLNRVGYELAFAACDGFWSVIIRNGYVLVPVRSLVRTRSDA